MDIDGDGLDEGRDAHHHQDPAVFYFFFLGGGQAQISSKTQSLHLWLDTI